MVSGVQMLSDISESRGVSKEKLNEAADKMLMFYPANDCVEYGLADTLVYKKVTYVTT